MEDQWKYIDMYDSMPIAEHAHIDTRDFHMIIHNEKSQEPAPIDYFIENYMKDVKPEIFELSLFAPWQVLGWLKTLEIGSGGRLEWRFLHFNHPHKRGYKDWLKYIRLRKIVYKEIPCYFAYTTSAGVIYPLRWDFHIQENINDGNNY